MNREDILAFASQAVAERGQSYGKPSENFERIAGLWSSYTGYEFKIEDVGIMMMLVKIARLMEAPHHTDSWVDIAGYAAVTAEAIADSLSNQPLPVDQQSNVSSLSETLNGD